MTGKSLVLISIQAVHPFVHSKRDRLQREFAGWRERAETAAIGNPDVLLGDGYPAASDGNAWSTPEGASETSALGVHVLP